MNRSILLPLLALSLLGCEQTSKDDAPPPRRFAAVKKADPKQAAAKFCERTFEAGKQRWSAPPKRKLPRPAKTTPNPEAKAWTWVNLWASWCGPCVEEMPLLDRWKNTLQKERLPLRMELWTIDEEAEPLAEALRERTYPGEVHWLRGEEDLPGLLASLGLATDTAIPVHALIDPSGHVRCVRVGKVGEANYAAIKTILRGAL